MSGVMTGDVERAHEAVVVSASWRRCLRSSIVGGFTLPLVAKFGQGNNAKGWQMTMALVGGHLRRVLSDHVRARLVSASCRPKAEIDRCSKDFGNLLKNGPWIAMFVLTLVALHFPRDARRHDVLLLQLLHRPRAAVSSSCSAWDCRRRRPRAPTAGITSMNILGLIVNADRSNVAYVGFSLFNIASQAVTVLGVIASTSLAMRFGKRAVALVGFTLATMLDGSVHSAS